MLTVAYDGTGYAGFARQPEVQTVQGKLEEALRIVTREPVTTVCAGRTDAGVHALGQQASFPVVEGFETESDLGRLKRSLDALTPDDIAIRGARFERTGFSARFDAKEREYRYRIVAGSTPPVFMRRFAWWHKGPSLDIPAMRLAADHLVGEHDFRSFCMAASAEGRTTWRYLDRVELLEESHLGEDCLVVRVIGNAFLHNMVRIIVGTLVEVGAGRREPSWVVEVLGARDRSAAGPTAPACGLTFWEVRY